MTDPQSPSPSPAGPASCQLHATRLGDRVCADCGKPFCRACVMEWEGDFLCRGCLRAYRAPEDEEVWTGEEAHSERVPAPPIAHLLSPRFLLRIVFHPRAFFTTMPTQRGHHEPFLFAFFWLMVIFILAVPSRFLDVKAATVLEAKLRELSGPAATTPEESPGPGERGDGEDPRANVARLAERTPKEVLGALLANVPSGVGHSILLTLLQALFHHSLVWLYGYRSSFEVAMRIAFFALAASAISILPIPILASLAATVYEYVLCVLGFQIVFRMPTHRALTVGILPLLLVQILTVPSIIPG